MEEVSSTLRFFDPCGLEEKVLGLRFDSEAEVINEREAEWVAVVGAVSSLYGRLDLRDVDGEGEGGGFTGGFNFNGTTAPCRVRSLRMTLNSKKNNSSVHQKGT
jgi:hypothetical protein